MIDSLVDSINSTSSYKVTELGSEGIEETTITNYRAVNYKKHESDIVDAISTADIVTCSVGPTNLKFIAPIIAKGIDSRSSDVPLYVIACENAIGASDTLARLIKDPGNISPERVKDHHLRARYANSLTDRIVPDQGSNAGLDVSVEKFFEWVVDSTPFEDIGTPSIEGVQWVDDIFPFYARKNYTSGAGRVAAAYHGYNREKSTVCDALNDTDISNGVSGVLSETSHLVVSRQDIDDRQHAAYLDKILKRLSNPHLELGVERVGRSPLRKLSRRECLIGPAVELAEEQRPFSHLLDAIEMCFRFQNVGEDEESKQLAKIMSENTPEDVVTKVCGVHSDEKIYSELVQVVKRVQGGM